MYRKMDVFLSATHEEWQKESTIDEGQILQGKHSVYNTEPQRNSAVFVEHGNGVPKEASFLLLIFLK